MKKFKHFIVAGLLAALSGAAAGIPVIVANPAIYGDWRLEMNVDLAELPSPLKGGICEFIGDMTLLRQVPIKAGGDKISDPVSGQAQMQLRSGPCGDFLGEISGNAFADNIAFSMAVFPIITAKDNAAASTEKGDPIYILGFEGMLISEDLMEGEITNAFLTTKSGEADPDAAKGEIIGTFRATRGGAVPAVTPVGILLLLAGLGLAGGIALRRRSR